MHEDDRYMEEYERERDELAEQELFERDAALERQRAHGDVFVCRDPEGDWIRDAARGHADEGTPPRR